MSYSCYFRLRFFYFLILHITRTHFFFFFNDTATTEIYTLSLHDALPICNIGRVLKNAAKPPAHQAVIIHERWEEHTSELQSRLHLVCRLLLEKKKKNHKYSIFHIHSPTLLASATESNSST